MKKLVALVACLGMLAIVSCGPSEAERKLQDSLSKKRQDSTSNAEFDAAMKDMGDMNGGSDSAKKDSLKKDSIAKATAAPKK